jgi:hypothetical protein
MGKNSIQRAVVAGVDGSLPHHAHCPVAVVRANGGDERRARA